MLTADFAHTTPCPVLPLAIEAVRLVNQMNRYDGVAFELYDAALDRLGQVERCAIDQRARSQGGLFFQACLAYGAAGCLMSWVPTDLQPKATPMRHEIEGATLSIAQALVIDELAVLADHYLPKAVAAQVAA